MIVSGDQFVAGAEERQAILEKLPFARACEMESTAIAQACYRFYIPFIIIRAISDQADGQRISALMNFWRLRVNLLLR